MTRIVMINYDQKRYHISPLNSSTTDERIATQRCSTGVTMLVSKNVRSEM